MSSIFTVAVAVTTTGTAGAASGSASTESLFGYVLDVYLDFHASAPATTDTTIAYATRGGNILAVANSATDAMIAPRQALVNNANAAITGSHDRFALNGPLTITVAESDALAPAVTAYIRILRP